MGKQYRFGLAIHLEEGDVPTLSEALEDVTIQRWAGMRSEERNTSQASEGIHAIELIMGVKNPELAEVTKDHLRAIVRRWRQSGTSPATIVIRLNCLSAMGLDVKGTRPRVSKKPKWWLDEASEATLASWCAGQRPACYHTMANLMRWTTRTGLRIEESLRMTWSRITVRTIKTDEGDVRRVSVTVPGTKTSMSEASLVLSADAIRILDGLPRGNPHDPLFPISYGQACRAWVRMRKQLQLPDPSLATMKALRRSAARNLHAVKGMPLHMVQQYLRHENVKTTMGYLHLTGGYNEEEMAKWLT